MRWIGLAFGGRIEESTLAMTWGSHERAEEAGADGQVVPVLVETPVDRWYVLGVRPMQDVASGAHQTVIN